MKNIEELASAIQTITSHYFSVDFLNVYNFGDFDNYMNPSNCEKPLVSVAYEDLLVEAFNLSVPQALEFVADLLALGFIVKGAETSMNEYVLDIELENGVTVTAIIYID